jgi:hypothetical protein
MKEAELAKRCRAAGRAGATLWVGGMLGGWLTPAAAQVAPSDPAAEQTLAPIVVVGTTPLLASARRCRACRPTSRRYAATTSTGSTAAC